VGSAGFGVRPLAGQRGVPDVVTKRSRQSGSGLPVAVRKSNSLDPPTVTEPKPCKAAGDDARHRARPVHGADPLDACDCGYCHTCHYARKRHRRRSQRLSAVRRSYGLSEADLDALMAAQRGRCPCGRRIGVTRSPNVDHWHGCPWCSGKGCRRCVRGLTCGPCNTHIGYVGDRPEAMIGLAIHLATMPAQAVLTALDREGTIDTSASADRRTGSPEHPGTER